MNKKKRLFEEWRILVECANKREKITYEDISSRVSSTGNRGQFINTDLGIIREMCRKMNLPRLNTLVVRKSDGECGDSVFGQVHNHELTPDEERKFVFDNPDVFNREKNPFQ